jgi:hypothetical protein
MYLRAAIGFLRSFCFQDDFVADFLLCHADPNVTKRNSGVRSETAHDLKPHDCLLEAISPSMARFYLRRNHSPALRWGSRRSLEQGILLQTLGFEHDITTRGPRNASLRPWPADIQPLCTKRLFNI